MDSSDEKNQTEVHTVVHDDEMSLRQVDDAKLAELGYKNEFEREFSVSHGEQGIRNPLNV